MARDGGIVKAMTSVVLAATVLILPNREQNVQASSRQTREVFGVVSDAGRSSPLQNVRVYVRGTRIGTISAANGDFLIRELPDSSLQIVITHPCYFPVAVNLPAGQSLRVDVGLPFDETSQRRAGCGGLGARLEDLDPS